MMHPVLKMLFLGLSYLLNPRLWLNIVVEKVIGSKLGRASRYVILVAAMSGARPKEWRMWNALAHYHAQLGLLDKGRAIKELVV